MAISRPELNGTLGAVSSTHWLASGAGMRMLENGGNAFDAAVAAAFVLQVTEPHYNGLGGDVSIVAHAAATDQQVAVCGQGGMPAAATIDSMRDLGLDRIPGSGLLPACVPGAFDAWMRLLLEFGTKRLEEVLSPALGYASDGFPILPGLADAINGLAPLFTSEWPSSGVTYMPDGRPPGHGARFRNPLLAETYRRLLAEAGSGTREAQIERARGAFYEGFVAETIDAFVRAGRVLDATGVPHRGLITGDDLAGWRAGIEDTTALVYRGRFRVSKPGPWSQGPVFLQQLALLDGLGLDGMAPGSAEYVHTLAEAAKLAFADREAWYGDPEFSDVPLADLLSPEYNDARRKLIEGAAAGGLDPGAPGGRSPRLPEPTGAPATPDGPDWLVQLGNGLPTVLRRTLVRNDTCCVTASDRAGNVVAATPSGGWLKSSPAIPGLGFPLGTRGQTMCLTEGHPNALEPRKRPRTTLSPTVVVADDAPSIGFGTPGGDRQDQWTLQFFLAWAEHGRDLQEATETLAFHSDMVPSSFTPHESRPGVLVVEEDAGDAVLDELAARGHEVERAPARSLGKVCAAGFDPEHSIVTAGASPRGRQPYAMCR